MSKLSNHQIKAEIASLEMSVTRATGATLKTRKALLERYRAELAAREAAGVDPGTSLQAVRFGEPAGRPAAGSVPIESTCMVCGQFVPCVRCVDVGWVCLPCQRGWAA